MAFVAVCGIAGIGLVVAYQLGIFDRPEFVYNDSLLKVSNDTTTTTTTSTSTTSTTTRNEAQDDDEDEEQQQQTYLYAIVACTTEKQIGRHIERIMMGVRNGLLKTIPNGDEMMKAAATFYNSNSTTSTTTTVSDDTTTNISIGLYFDNPTTVEKPRWVAGWAIQNPTNNNNNINNEYNSTGTGTTKSFIEHYQTYSKQIHNNSGGLLKENECIRIIRIGKGCSILRGCIPVRTMITPMIAPMIQWKRAFQAMDCSSSSSNGGGGTSNHHVYHDTSKERCTPLALELYMYNTIKKCISSMEYIILMGNVTTVWDDTYPLIDSTTTTTTTTTSATSSSTNCTTTE